MLLQELVERMGLLAIDLDLGEHRKADAVGQRTEFPDLRLVAWFLMTELVAGEAKDREAACRVFLLQRLESLVLRRESALARHVDDQQRAATVIGQRALTAVDGLRGELVDVRHGVLPDRAGKSPSSGSLPARRQGAERSAAARLRCGCAGNFVRLVGVLPGRDCAATAGGPLRPPRPTGDWTAD